MNKNKTKNKDGRDTKGRFVPGNSIKGGRKNGGKNKETIAKGEALERYYQSMLQKLTPIMKAQQLSAEGLMVVLRPALVKNPKTKILERTGDLRQVKDPDEIEELFNSDGLGRDYHVVFAKDPNAKAIQDIFDRVFGKAKEHVELNFKAKGLKEIQDGMRMLIEMSKLRDGKKQ